MTTSSTLPPFPKSARNLKDHHPPPRFSSSVHMSEQDLTWICNWQIAVWGGDFAYKREMNLKNNFNLKNQLSVSELLGLRMLSKLEFQNTLRTWNFIRQVFKSSCFWFFVVRKTCFQSHENFISGKCFKMKTSGFSNLCTRKTIYFKCFHKINV